MDNAFFMVGSFRSQLMHSKLIFEIFRDEQTQALLNNEEKKFYRRTRSIHEKNTKNETLTKS